MSSSITGIKGKYFQNWANTYWCRPSLYLEPESIDQLREILKLANENKKVLKICGAGHSPSSVTCTDDYMVSLKKLDKILDVIFLVLKFLKNKLKSLKKILI